MTLYQTVSSTAGLAYGLGGQSTTAQYTSNYAYMTAHQYLSLTAEQRVVMDRAVRDGRARFDYARDAYIFDHRGLEPESSAAWGLEQFRAHAAAQMQAAQMQATQAQMQAAQMQAQSITLASTSAGYQQTNLAMMQATIQKSTDATIRSMELLYDWLTPEQRRQLATRGFITVIGGKTKINYRIYEPANYNIHELDKNTGETLVKLCFQPVDRTLPKGDIWLCQKLALELDEENTLALANRSAHYQY